MQRALEIYFTPVVIVFGGVSLLNNQKLNQFFGKPYFVLTIFTAFRSRLLIFWALRRQASVWTIARLLLCEFWLIHSNDLEACWKKFCWFWFHSDVSLFESYSGERYLAHLGLFFTQCLHLWRAEIWKSHLLLFISNTEVFSYIRTTTQGVRQCSPATVYRSPHIHHHKIISNQHCTIK